MATARYERRESPRLVQGDIYRGVEVLEGSSPEDHRIASFRYSVIVTQDCDLEQDWKAQVEHQSRGLEDPGDKGLRHIMLVPAYVADAFREGQHIEGRTMRPWNTKEIERVQKQEHKRYDYLSRESGLLEQNLVVDFKHYFTVERDCFYRNSKETGAFEYLCTLGILYREALTRRFCEYLSRIGFPEQNALVLGLNSDA